MKSKKSTLKTLTKNNSNNKQRKFSIESERMCSEIIFPQ